MSVAAIMNLIPTMNAVALVSHNLKVVKKKDKKTKDMVNLGVTNVVGTSLIQSQAGIIASM